jgi:O-antigen/teichoic acid export membrane protein
MNKINSSHSKTITQRISSNLGWTGVSEIIGKGAVFIANIYLARTLGVENFGLFTFAQAITYYFWLGADLGTNMYGIREIARDKEHAEEIINSLFTLRLTSGACIFIIYSLILLVFFSEMASTTKLTFISCGLYIFTFSFFMDWVFKGLEQFRLIALGTFVSSTIYLVGIFLLVKGEGDIIPAALVWSSSFFFGGLSLFYMFHNRLQIKFIPSFNKKVWFMHLKKSVHFTIAGGLSALYNYLPILLTGILFSKYYVGLFSAPFKIISSLSAPGFFIASAFYPVVSDLYVNDRTAFFKAGNKLLLVMLTIGVPAAIVGFYFSKEIIIFLFGGQYLDSIIVFKVLIWLLPLQFIRYKYSTFLRSTEYQKWQFIPISIALVMMLIFIIFLPNDLNYLTAIVVMAELVLVMSYAWISRLTFNP